MANPKDPASASELGLRALSDDQANSLAPGDVHYRAFVGPPEQYDLIGASQFNLLCTLGLRERHKVLDFGCGSLRLGRLLIPFLRTGRYFAIEPNAWLVEDAIARQITRELVMLKAPTFLRNSDFNAASAGTDFHFIVAQSILSHAGMDIIETALNSFRLAMDEQGFTVVTVIHPGRGIAEAKGRMGLSGMRCASTCGLRFSDHASRPVWARDPVVSPAPDLVRDREAGGAGSFPAL